MDAYPYFENTKPNAIAEAKSLFDQALANTQGAGGDKPVWITETGYPVSGKKSGDAVANTKNARTYWEEVGCPLFGKTNTWWYTLQDSNSDGPRTDETPSFGVVGEDLTTPRYNLSCKGVKPKPSTSSSTPKPTTSKTSESTQTETSASVSDSEESQTEVSSTTAAPATTPTSGSGSSNNSSGNGSSDNNEEEEETNGSDGAASSPSPVPDAGLQLKSSFGAVVVALALAFFAL
jgi:glucan endo-1,3-beta-D-glucosidase